MTILSFVVCMNLCDQSDDYDNYVQLEKVMASGDSPRVIMESLLNELTIVRKTLDDLTSAATTKNGGNPDEIFLDGEFLQLDYHDVMSMLIDHHDCAVHIL